jgi:hypothetical protein
LDQWCYAAAERGMIVSVSLGGLPVANITDTADELQRKAQACRRLADIAESVGDPDRAEVWLRRANRREEQLTAFKKKNRQRKSL